MRLEHDEQADCPESFVLSSGRRVPVENHSVGMSMTGDCEAEFWVNPDSRAEQTDHPACWTPEERAELADYMIAQWQGFKSNVFSRTLDPLQRWAVNRFIEGTDDCWMTRDQQLRTPMLKIVTTAVGRVFVQRCEDLGVYHITECDTQANLQTTWLMTVRNRERIIVRGSSIPIEGNPASIKE